jgi:hypothetical protein
LVIAGLLWTAVAVLIGMLLVRSIARLFAGRSDRLGTVSQRWLAVHRREN